MSTLLKPDDLAPGLLVRVHSNTVPRHQPLPWFFATSLVRIGAILRVHTIDLPFLIASLPHDPRTFQLDTRDYRLMRVSPEAAHALSLHSSPLHRRLSLGGLGENLSHVHPPAHPDPGAASSD